MILLIFICSSYKSANNFLKWETKNPPTHPLKYHHLKHIPVVRTREQVTLNKFVRDDGEEEKNRFKVFFLCEMYKTFEMEFNDL